MEVHIYVPLLILLLVNLTSSQQCTDEDWSSTFAVAGDSMSQCSDNVSYVNGLTSQGYGSNLQTGPGIIGSARCCGVRLPYSQESNVCYWEQWWTDLVRHNSWAICEQPGYFIHGFFTIGPNFLSDIGMAQCCKPTSHPDENRGCRDDNVEFTVDGTKACPQGSFLKGFYKTTCSTINCLTQIRCCEMVPGRVDGGWSDWASWSECSVTCGGGSQRRFRTCANPPPSGGGDDCTGLPFQVQNCNENPCPVDGGWSNWSPWGACSVTCGGGSQVRSRNCTNPPPSAGGAQCTGNESEQQDCNTEVCAPVDGGWSPWSDWSACTLNCGCGTRSSNRTCTNPSPANGGEDCKGYDERRELCNQDVKCRFSKWSKWEKCDKTCGGGTTIRRRQCRDPPPCVGETEQTKECAKQPCKSKFTKWSKWGKCSKTCRGGTKTRTRTCTSDPPCSGKTEEKKKCGKKACS